MSLISRIPARTRARIALLFPGLTDSFRRAVMRRYYLPSVVVRESAMRRFVQKHVLRLYYPPSMVSREPALIRAFNSRVLRRKPRLYHFETHITDHCNLNCKGCGHFSNVSPKHFENLADFERDMGNMARLFEVEQIFLLGGEPLLHPDVDQFILTARRLFPRTRLYLMTNGVLVTRMNDTFWNAMKDTRTILLCDQYPINVSMEEIDQLAHEHDVVVEWTNPRGEFFKIPIDIQAGQDAQDSFRRCNGVNNCPMLRDGRLYPCAYIAYSDVLAERFGLTGIDATTSDSFAIDDDTDAAEAMRFMLAPVPWCSHCDFDAFHMFGWTRSQRTLDEWIDTVEPDREPV